MGEVRFFRAVQGGRDWVFAYLDGPDAVWGMDRLSGEEWWYEPAVTGWLAPMIRSRLASGVPIPEMGAPGTGAAASLPPVAQRYDLALHEPGHSVLAAFHARLVATGGVSPGAGMPDELTTLARSYVGELEVSSALDRLGSRWRVLHSVPAGAAGTGVDHVIIGPAGVFTILSRNHRGTIVNVAGDTVVAEGRQQTYVPDARHGAQQAQEALSAYPDLAMSVFPTIVVVGARLSVSHTPDFVSVVDATTLVDWLESLPPRLHQTQVVVGYDALRWSDAWTSSAPHAPAPDTTRALALERGLGLRPVPTTTAVAAPPPVVEPSTSSPVPAPIASQTLPEAPGDRAEQPTARSRAVTGPSGGRRSRPERGARQRKGSRGRTIAAVVASVMLVLLVAPSIVTGVQRAMSEPSASASQTPLPVSTLDPEIGGPCAPPDEATDGTGETLACNQGTGTWALRGVTATLDEPCPKVDQLGWSTTKNKPLVCAKDGDGLLWQVRTG